MVWIAGLALPVWRRDFVPDLVQIVDFPCLTISVAVGSLCLTTRLKLSNKKPGPGKTVGQRKSDCAQ